MDDSFLTIRSLKVWMKKVKRKRENFEKLDNIRAELLLSKTFKMAKLELKRRKKQKCSTDKLQVQEANLKIE